MSNHNLLIVSDLHLGADLKRHSVAQLRTIVRLDREFSRFLEWYTHHTDDGRPWRLLINGDMLDFLAVTALPTDTDEPGFDVDEDDRLYGLGTEESKVVWKTERIVRRHRRVFTRLAHFLAAGHEVVLLRGNHDVELHWPAVQTRLREMLAELAGDERVAERLRFEPWFYYEPGCVYVEHGHQYDEYSSFDYILHPHALRAEDELDVPLSHYAQRYIANRIESQSGLRVDDKDRWGLSDYARFIFGGKAGGPLAVLTNYLSVCWRVTRAWIRRNVTSHRRHRQAQARARKELARRFGLSEAKLTDLESYALPPATWNLMRTWRLYYFDRLAFYGAGLAALVGLMILAPPAALTVLGTLSVVGMLAAGSIVHGRWRQTRTAPKLRRASVRIGHLMNVPFVVFGHSHEATVKRIHNKRRRWYFNLGSWLDTPAGFTHVAIRRQPGGSRAELRRWSVRKCAPILMKKRTAS